MNRLNCRRVAHDARRYVRLLNEGNPFTLACVSRIIEELEDALSSNMCEPKVARKIQESLHVIEGWE